VTGRAAAALAAALALGASAGPAPAAAPEPSPVARRAADAITEPLLRAQVKFLSSDLLEGRAPATRGDALAREYVAREMEAMGLQPAAPGGGWFQPVPLVGVTTRAAAPLRFEAGGRTVELRESADYVVNAGLPRQSIRLDRAEVVFVGYGIVAPEQGWDDYKGTDVRGKVVLVMNDDPSDDPALFAGRTRLYYGRWTYKYEEAARHGAAGAIIIHTTPSAAYPWKVVQTSWAGEQFELPDEQEPKVAVRLWTTEDASRRIAALGGNDLDRLRASATRRDFRPVPLGVAVSVALECRVERAETANVIGRLPGRGRAAEAVLYTAHLDHLGVKPGAAPGDDAIYNGAIDNASGVSALLAIARAYRALPAGEGPERSVLFAAVGAEEQGTLGSEWLARNPPVPTGRMAAEINMDAMNPFGRTRDVVVIGLGKSTIDEVVREVARFQGRVVKGDPFPEKGSYYRSDHFPLAKAGVPALYADGGTDYVGRPPGWGVQTIERWQQEHYHQPSDEWRDDFDLSGMVEDARLLFWVGLSIADAPRMPRWRPGDEFEAARTRALDAARAAGSR
jgi:Zn-dependent M28 family amino/carboxypeptidase